MRATPRSPARRSRDTHDRRDGAERHPVSRPTDVPWVDGDGPRRLLERTPLGVPIAAAAVALALALCAWLGLVSADVAWTVGGVAFLFAETFALYGWIAWRRARQANDE